MTKDFKDNLRELRQEKNVTQLQLAQALHYTQSNISEWEKGTVEPKATALKALAAYFEVSIEYLLGLEDDFGARTAAPIGDSGLSSEERELLNVYRSLSPEMHETLWSLLATWTPTEILKPLKK